MATWGNGSYLHFRPFDHVNMISPRPVLLIAGENARSASSASRHCQSGRAGAGHVDRYDKVEIIRWAKLDGFFRQHLAA